MEIKLYVEYVTTTGNGRNDFNSLQDLKKWLDKHPEFAKKLGYIKK